MGLALVQQLILPYAALTATPPALPVPEPNRCKFKVKSESWSKVLYKKSHANNVANSSLWIIDISFFTFSVNCKSTYTRILRASLDVQHSIFFTKTLKDRI